MGGLAGLFAPNRVAVVGASDREGTIGRAVMENLLADFDGEIVPVNPEYDECFDLACVDTITETNADLAVLVVPAPVVLQVLESAGESGIENVVVISAGFGEAGGEGASLERRLAEIADEYDLNLVGPNCLGVISTPVGLNATFSPTAPSPGSISFMSQSGAFVTAVLDWAADRAIGFKDVVSLGNKAVLDECDFLQAWNEDPETEVVIGYLEGIESGEQFVDTAREVTSETPVVIAKSGRTEAGARAAASHTGAIAGSEAAYEAGLDQAGVIRVDRAEELFEFGAILAGQPVPATDGVGIVTNAGGPGVMATDAIGDAGLELADFSEETIDALDDVLPSAASRYNPVDVIGDADAERFRRTMETVATDPSVGSLLVVACPSAPLSFEELADGIVDLAVEIDVPIVSCLMGGPTTREATDALAEADIPSYFDPARAVASLDALRRYRVIQSREYQTPQLFDVDRQTARDVLERVHETGDNRLGVEAMELLDAYGIPTPEGGIVDSPAAARDLAESIDGDVVMKIVSPDILHKTDIGGVEVGVADADVEDTYEDLVTRARAYQSDARLLGVQVQELVDVDAGVETIVGTTRDPQFGQLVLFGLGGIFVEVFEDTTLRVTPVTEQEAESMIDDLQAAPLLRGARGTDPVAEAEIVEVIQRLSQLVSDFPAILELDVNPLVATPDGVFAVDLRLTADPEEL